MTDQLSAAERAMFTRAAARHREIEKLQAEAGRDAKVLNATLVGKRVVKMNKCYQLVRIENGWDGTIHARGQRVLADGTVGTKVWDIDFIHSSYFDAATYLGPLADAD